MIIVKYSFVFNPTEWATLWSKFYRCNYTTEVQEHHLEPKIYHITEYFWTKNIVLLEMPMQKTKSINTKWEHKLPAERVNVSPEHDYGGRCGG